MTQYISKSALVAEIEKLKNEDYYDIYDEYDGFVRNALDKVLSSIDTFEVKDADLEKEYKDFVEEDPVYNKLVNGIVGKNIAKHFFNLGLRASNPLTWEDMRELHIIFSSLDVDIELSRSKLQEETLGYYEEVLKRFKAQKGKEV